MILGVSGAPNLTADGLEQDFSSGTDASSSEDEEETQDTLSGIFDEPVGDTANDTRSGGLNTSTMGGGDDEVEEDEPAPSRRGSKRSPTTGGDPNGNNEMEKELKRLQLQVAKLEGQSVVTDIVKMNADTMGVIISNQKRAAMQEKKSEQPEAPIMEVWSEEGERVEDDNNSIFAWGVRRLYKQPNADPKSYWEKAGYKMKVSPNLRDSLYLQHLMPMNLSSKALSWGHDLVATTAIKYFTHSQASSSAKKRKTELSIEECEESMSQRVVTTGQQWGETNGMNEVVEACLNWGAIRFMVAPWDWSPMLLIRVLHEVAFFSTVAEDEVGQKTVAEKFVDEFLQTNRRLLMQGKPPLVYNKALTLAQDVVRKEVGRQDMLFTKCTVYTASRLAKKYRDEADRLREEKKELQRDKNKLQQKVNSLERSRPRSPPRRNDNGRDRRDLRDQRDNTTPEENAFRLDRASVCKEWNTPRGCTRTVCNRSHVCNARAAPGRCCKSDQHKGPQHR